MADAPCKSPDLPPETRRWGTIDEVEALFAAHLYPAAARTLRRLPIPSKRVGRSLLFDLDAARRIGEAVLDEAPTIVRQTSRTPNKPKLKIAGG